MSGFKKEELDHAHLRPDLRIVADMVAPGSRVLDVGCGDGMLLAYLDAFKEVDGRGVEISQAGVNACVSHGLSVIQGDADADLKDYPSDAFDYVILSQTLQATHDPKRVVAEMIRIGHRAIISFPNFGYWRIRFHLMCKGQMPVTDLLCYQWYETPNIHLCTIRDFITMCLEIGASIERGVALDRKGRTGNLSATGFLANWIADQAIFLLRRV